jgi:glycosyltransferase involved in cell wall biosynthesis
MKVLMLPKWYPNKYYDLDGVFVVDHVKAIAQKHDVKLLFVHSDHEMKWGKRVMTSSKNGFEEETVYFGFLKTGIRKLDRIEIFILYLWYLFASSRRIKKSWGKADITHVHVLTRSSILALYKKWFQGIPYIVSEHFSGYDPSNRYRFTVLKKGIIRFVFNRASAISTVSEYLKQNIQRFTKNPNFHVISNCIDANLFKPKDRKDNPKSQFIHVSTIDDFPKNFGGILKAMKLLSERNNQFELHVYGSGVELERQKDKAKELGLFDVFVFFHGKRPKQEIADKLAESDLKILFSHYETQSCVLLESFLCGTPAVSSAVGGAKEIISKTNGILVQSDDCEALAGACVSFLSKGIVFDRKKIREEAVGFCSYEAVSEKFDSMYRNT